MDTIFLAYFEGAFKLLPYKKQVNTKWWRLTHKPPLLPSRLLDVVRGRSMLNTAYEQNYYVISITLCIVFHGKLHPKKMSKQKVEAFLGYLAVEQHVSAATQTQGRSQSTISRHHPHNTLIHRPHGRAKRRFAAGVLDLSVQ